MPTNWTLIQHLLRLFGLEQDLQLDLLQGAEEAKNVSDSERLTQQMTHMLVRKFRSSCICHLTREDYTMKLNLQTLRATHTHI